MKFDFTSVASPYRLAVALTLAVALAQFAVMAALHLVFEIDALPWWVELLADTAALTLLVSVLVLFGLVRPLQRALLRERERARIVLENASEGIVTIDGHGTIRAFNRAAEGLFGYSPAEAIGCNVSLIVPEPEKARHDAYMRRYRATGHGHVVNTRRQVQAQRRDGSVFAAEMSMSKIDLPDETLFTAIIHDITERRKMEERIHHLAYHDALTRLPNRALYYDRLTHSLALAHRERGKVGLLLLDLDDFKPVNDRHGHDAGDQLLREIAARLQGLVRDSDTVARLGGDEFAVILSSIPDRASAEETARRVGAIVAEPYALDAATVTIGVSVGVGIYPDDGLEIDDLARVADRRMYRAKAKRKAEAAALLAPVRQD